MIKEVNNKEHFLYKNTHFILEICIPKVKTLEIAGALYIFVLKHNIISMYWVKNHKFKYHLHGI